MSLSQAQFNKLRLVCMYMDPNYLSDEANDFYSGFDINSPANQYRFIELAMRDDVMAYNDISLDGFKSALKDVQSYPEGDVLEALGEIGSPFVEPLRRHRDFFAMIFSYFFEDC